MSEEAQGGGGLKSAIIGLITIIVTAIAGVIGKNIMGGDEAATAPVPAVAPVIINLENNNTVGGGGSGGGTAAPAAKPAPKKDDWTKAEPKW
jgi:hypothetical protein